MKKAKLKDLGVKSTPIREAVFNLFKQSECCPLSAEDVRASLKKLNKKDFDLVTIYRAISLLEQSNLITKIDLHKSSAYYEFVDDSHHHHHIVCTKCGATEGFENCNIDKLVGSVLKNASKFSNITKHSFELFGLCNTCTKK